jgi:xanthine/uracil permease
MMAGARAPWPLESNPPATVLLPAVLQHVGLGVVTLVLPRLVAEAAGAGDAILANYIALSMIVMGVATLLQTWGRHGIGSGFLLPAAFSAIYLPPALAAAQAGGLGAVAGLTLIAGVTQIVCSFLVRRLRPYLPTELAGLVVVMVGLSLGLLGLRLMLGVGPGARTPVPEWAGPLAAAATILTLTVWGGPRWRPLAVLLGLAAGIAAHLAQTLALGGAMLPVQPALDIPAWPLAMPTVPWGLLPGMAVGALACLVRASGDIVACQKANDPAWKRPDFRNLRAGVMADGLGCVLGGLVGVPGTNTYTASVGLSIASGVMARRVALAVGAAWILLGLLPGAPALLLAVPRSVLGAALFFTAGFILVTGMGIVAQRALDARRTLMIGAALIIGVSYDAMPQWAAALPDAARMLATSSLVLGTAVGLALNLAFRAGTAQHRRQAWRPAEGHAALEDFALAAGGAWGARAEVVARLRGALEEAAALLATRAESDAPVEVAGRFDEYNLDVTLRWTGGMLRAEGGQDDEGDHLAALLLWRGADRVAESGLPDGRRELRLHYDH